MHAHPALLAAFSLQLAVVRLDIPIQFPRVVGNLDVDPRQSSVVPIRFAA
jgi:hypothetical protein